MHWCPCSSAKLWPSSKPLWASLCSQVSAAVSERTKSAAAVASQQVSYKEDYAAGIVILLFKANS